MATLRTSRKRKSKPITRWLSRDAITAKRTRRKLERRWARSKLESDRLAFRNACRYANKLIVQSRASYFRQQLTSAPNCKRRWQIAKELLHVAPVNCVGFGSVTISCQSFADFFKSKIDNLKRTVASLAKMSSPPTFDDPSFNGTPLDVLATLDPSTVLKIITQMKPKSSAVDYIPTSLIKSCSTVFSELICNLANLSFAEGIFPNSFKLADVTPRLKKLVWIQQCQQTTVQFQILIIFQKFLSDYFCQYFNRIFCPALPLTNYSQPIGLGIPLKQHYSIHWTTSIVQPTVACQPPWSLST